MTKLVSPPGDVPALGMSFQTTLDKNGQRQVVMQTHIGVDATDDEINALVDKVYRAVDRQIAKYELIEARKMLEDDTKTLIRLREDLGRVDKRQIEDFLASGKQGTFDPDKHLRPAERQERGNVLTSVKRYEEAIHKTRARVDELEALVNGHAVPGTTDRHAG